MGLLNIKQIACKARKDFENETISYDELKQLYHQYNPIEEIEFFIKSARQMFPHFNCGLASVYLRKLFPNGKIVKGKYGENEHTFLLIGRSVVVDITADQYGGPKVYVGPLQEPWNHTTNFPFL